MPPEIVNSANNKMIKGIYSNNITWNNWLRVSSRPFHNKKGSRKVAAQLADILP